ncbi:type II-A CRISPR-associated protein Csn2 [Fructilactobacillus fructivorans]|uniref:Type II-A CRISPR-associated protein Csn2 n=1 Tax=Fructilactobacillus fructivorans TaxID=1614 RepID=A0A0C1PQW1_9LACO|nr:type II-A CRISPR-associated protein Csn2 [Fructilactobacillus fructivorans]KID42261.1 hypothetical protein LfDm3_0190 [Fructilactobacillus fructivorans]MCT0151116.1 type II-A CRISPR-associated protein Csn2 [Fructilactobacillus fructivorans]MCT2867326.1 type II-A CRISPR-associated protein Csn2 [Fructilactobacillus fructivorans]MCT2869155.1 type II-A CRISPR-associated protein Csn2 [Fructilactobacillus fructivorans]MCT2873125.1 type II-A CRISPR-associated protein Csn2 [Fructilactobacillus fruc
MKVTIFPTEPFEVENGILTVVQTSSPKFYTDFIKGLSTENGLTISEDDEILNFASNVTYLKDVVTNPYVFDAFKSSLQNQVVDNLNENNRQELFRIDRRIKDIFLQSAYMEDVPLEINDEWNLKKMVKYAGIQMVSSTVETPYDIITSVLNLFKKFNPKKLIVLNDLFNYLNSSQISDLIQVIKALDLKVLILNFSDSFKKDDFKKCRNYYIDADLVRWTD